MEYYSKQITKLIEELASLPGIGTKSAQRLAFHILNMPLENVESLSSAIVDARISQNLTQRELAERTGINQADISKLENGTRNPSVNLLKRLADGMGMTLKIEFVPK